MTISPAARTRVEHGTYVVALVLAVSMGLALNIFSFAMLWDAIHSRIGGLSENATQILSGWGGGIIGIIGAVIGYSVGSRPAGQPYKTERYEQ